MTFKYSVKNYGLKSVYGNHKDHSSFCRKCHVQIDHPLGVAFEICYRCGNLSYQVRWTHIEDLVCSGQVIFRARSDNVDGLREKVRILLIERKFLYDYWTINSLLKKNSNFHSKHVVRLT